jgi:predicted nucleotidyltransferase
MAFSTAKLDQLLEERSQRDEAERQTLVNKLLQWLDVHGTQCGIRKAYLFGSLAQPHRFHQQSDIDIAIQPDHPVDLFALIGTISELTGRDVDLIELEKSHFAHRIRQTGIKWTATD